VKAISPVIATVILVAVAIALSIAIALWITGMTAAFTGVEKLEVVNAYAEMKTQGNNVYWNVTVTVKNTGTKPATVDLVFVNNKAGYISAVVRYEDGQIKTGQFTIDPGKSKTIWFILGTRGSETVEIDKVKVKQDGQEKEKPVVVTLVVPDKFSSGQTVSIVIHTASGGQYPTTVTLP